MYIIIGADFIAFNNAAVDAYKLILLRIMQIADLADSRQEAFFRFFRIHTGFNGVAMNA